MFYSENAAGTAGSCTEDITHVHTAPLLPVEGTNNASCDARCSSAILFHHYTTVPMCTISLKSHKTATQLNTPPVRYGPPGSGVRRNWRRGYFYFPPLPLPFLPLEVGTP